jgi:lipopolysaccharide heptosyltransferase II
MKILITYLTGIGNTIMYIPTLRTLHQQLPDAIIDVVVRHQASKEILERINCCRKIYVFNPSIHKTFAQKIYFLRTLRKERYDVNITTFPSNRAEFNLLSFFIGAKRRISLRYEVGYTETLGFLQTELVEADATRHEIDQNLSLLAPLGVNIFLAEKNGGLYLQEQEEDYAEAFLKKANLTPKDVLIGFHPGCNPAQGNIYKRWPPKHFGMLGDKLVEQFGAKIFVGFGGSEEDSLYREIYDFMKHKPIIPESTSILKTAAIIKQCKLFVAGDSGLMHLATVMKVPTVAIFGPVDVTRSAPVGAADTVIKADLPCVPCNKYPHYQYGGSFIRCVYNSNRKGHCMQSITVEKVYNTIVQNYASILQPVNI